MYASLLRNILPVLLPFVSFSSRDSHLFYNRLLETIWMSNPMTPICNRSSRSIVVSRFGSRSSTASQSWANDQWSPKPSSLRRIQQSQQCITRLSAATRKCWRSFATQAWSEWKTTVFWEWTMVNKRRWLYQVDDTVFTGDAHRRITRYWLLGTKVTCLEEWSRETSSIAGNISRSLSSREHCEFHS